MSVRGNPVEKTAWSSPEGLADMRRLIADLRSMPSEINVEVAIDFMEEALSAGYHAVDYFPSIFRDPGLPPWATNAPAEVVPEPANAAPAGPAPTRPRPIGFGHLVRRQPART